MPCNGTSCSMIYISGYIKTGTDIQGILQFCLRSLRGCNVGLTDGRNFPIHVAHVMSYDEL
jgi:hypothetical protein